MEETLGKRISANRKRLGLTQDKLAEQLDVTAQAVSKWENDQACPDITTLPKLAEIFGITTDALLGVEKAPVYQAEVVEEDETEPEGIHIHNGSWNFHWDAGRKNHLGFALWVLLVGGLLLASNFLNWNAGWWSIAWPSALLVFGLMGLVPRFPFSRIVSSLIGGYYLMENLGLITDNIPSGVIFPLILVVLGVSLLVDAFRKSKKPTFRVHHKGSNTHKTEFDCSNSSDSFQCSLNFGENRHVVDVPLLRSGEANLSFGELTVDLCRCGAIAENCTINANCAFGELCFIVPKCFEVKTSSNTSVGAVSVNGEPDSDPKGIIYMEANVSFGEISIEYV